MRIPVTESAGDPFEPADANRWAARVYWTPDEIAALSLGKCPWSLNRGTVAGFVSNWFSVEFCHRWDILCRAVHMGCLPERCPPNRAIEWLNEAGIPCDEALIQEVNKRHPIVDWMHAYHQSRASYERNQAEMRDIVERYRQAHAEAYNAAATLARQCGDHWELIEQLLEREHELAARVFELQTRCSASDDDSAAENDNSRDEIAPKKQTSLDWMIAGLAIEGYGYDPASPRSPIPRDIESDIAKVGGSLGAETISKHIRDACKRLGIKKRPDAED